MAYSLEPTNSSYHEDLPINYILRFNPVVSVISVFTLGTLPKTCHRAATAMLVRIPFVNNVHASVQFLDETVYVNV